MTVFIGKFYYGQKEQIQEAELSISISTFSWLITLLLALEAKILAISSRRAAEFLHMLAAWERKSICRNSIWKCSNAL